MKAKNFFLLWTSAGTIFVISSLISIGFIFQEIVLLYNEIETGMAEFNLNQFSSLIVIVAGQFAAAKIRLTIILKCLWDAGILHQIFSTKLLEQSQFNIFNQFVVLLGRQLGDLVCPGMSSAMPMPVVKLVQPDLLEQLAQEVRLDQRGLTDCLDHLGRTELNHILDCLDLQVILDRPESWDLLDFPDYLDNHANRVALDRPALQGLRALLDLQATLGLLGQLANPVCRDILAYPAYLGHQDSTGRMANIAIVHREQHPKSNR
uniref:Uncharacterized protein n=1 Tax=Globodera rostochiensis TaxID=31243 RepID=A0A914IC72_GLORO